MKNTPACETEPCLASGGFVIPEKEITGSIRYTHGVSSRDYLWPIPSGEREKNPELIQNPGWGEN